MRLAGGGDLFQIIIFIIIFIGPALVKMFTAVKEKMDGMNSNNKQVRNSSKPPAEEYVSSQEDLDAWLKSIETAKVKKAKTPIVKKVVRKKSKRKVVKKSTPPPIEVPRKIHFPRSKSPEVAPPSRGLKPKTKPKVAKVVKKTKTPKQKLSSFLQGPSRKNAIILGDILGKPHALR